VIVETARRASTSGSQGLEKRAASRRTSRAAPSAQKVLYLWCMPKLSARPLLDNVVDDQLFVDRTDELAQLQRALAAQFNSVVIGTRGSGKTSLLRRLTFCLRAQDVRTVFLDGAVAPSAAELLDVLREQLFGVDVTRVPMMEARLTRVLGRAEVQQSETGRLLGLVSSLRDGYAEQEQQAREAERERLRGRAPVYELEPSPRVVLLDGLPSADVGHTLFGRLRDELWSLPISWVVAIRDIERGRVLRPPADAFFETQVMLPPLQPLAAEELLRRRLSPDDLVEDETLTAVVAHTDRQPRSLIATLRDTLVHGGSPETLATRRAELLHRLNEAGGRSAVMLAAELQALGGASASDDDLLQRLGWTRSRTSRLLHQLAQEGLVIGSERRDGSGGRPRRVYELVEPGL